MKCKVILVLLLGGICAVGKTVAKVVKSGAPMLGNMKVERVLCLGNSITHHGPSKKVSWTGNWGMAASCQKNDYVHVLGRGIAEKTGAKPNVMAKNIAVFERKHTTYDIQDKLQKQINFKPDVLVLAIGENVPALTTPEAQEHFRKALRNLLSAFTKINKPHIFVRSSFWANKVKDTILKEICAEFAGTFVDISALSKDEKNYARSERKFEHAGVAKHPGDRGMKAIADAILDVMITEK